MQLISKLIFVMQGRGREGERGTRERGGMNRRRGGVRRWRRR
jgi:hypothetical protein